MRLVSWNVAGRAGRAPEQARVLMSIEPDVVCLQEVTPRSAGTWQALLSDAGFTFLMPELPRSRASSRPLAVLTAARELAACPQVEDVPWPERVLAARACGVEVVNVHSPVSEKPELAKVRTHEAVFRHLATGEGPRLVCGDLNTPRREHADGSVWTFARTNRGVLRRDRGERHDAAEYALVRGLEPRGFRDAFRTVQGFGSREATWEWPRGGGYRLDHLIVSPELEVSDCSYRHDWRRELGLSDHSALVAELAPADGPRSLG